MTLFEYLSVAVSIVLGLGVTHLLANVKQILDPKRRYWVHAIWVVQLLLIFALEWWALWSFRDVAWNFGHFVFVIFGPGILFACATILVPTETQADWRSHYYSNHRWFFLSLFGLLLHTVLLVWLVGGIFIVTPSRPLWSILGVGAIVLAATQRDKVHETLTWISVLMLIVLALDQFRPDSVL